MDSRSRIALCALLLIVLCASVNAQKQSMATQPSPTSRISGATAPDSQQASSAAEKSSAELLQELAASDGPFRGARDAKVTIVFFDDYQCPYCEYMYKVLFNDVMKKYDDKVKVYLKDVPNSTIHAWAKRASTNARCLAFQSTEAYWDFTDQVHFNRPKIADTKRLDEMALNAGRTIAVDLPRLEACLKQQPGEAITEGYRVAVALGVEAVPTLFVNEEKVSGAVSAEVLSEAIDRAFAKLRDTDAQSHLPLRMSKQYLSQQKP